LRFRANQAHPEDYGGTVALTEQRAVTLDVVFAARPNCLAHVRSIATQKCRARRGSIH
jgi:hypothetical protein